MHDLTFTTLGNPPPACPRGLVASRDDRDGHPHDETDREIGVPKGAGVSGAGCRLRRPPVGVSDAVGLMYPTGADRHEVVEGVISAVDFIEKPR